jgi:DNA-binding transcriptional ArsR family regulator
MTHAFDALGNAVRRDILRTLRDAPLSVVALSERFPISRPAVSRHLKVLEDAGLVASHRDGALNLYSVRIEGLSPVRQYLDEFWDLALARLQELARAERRR